MKRPITISSDFAYELCDLLATFCGFAEGVANVVPSFKKTSDPVVARAESAADRLRPLLAESIAAGMMREAEAQR